AAVAFARGLGAWDYVGAAHAADTLVAAAVRGERWVPPQDLLDGAVTAKLLSEQGRDARRYYKTLSPFVVRSPDDVRSRLLYAYTLVERKNGNGPLGVAVR